MKSKSHLSNVLVILIASLPLIYLAVTWKHIPDLVTTRYDINMAPHKTGYKSFLWFPSGVIAGVSVLLYFLLENLHYIDPKRQGVPASSAFSRLALVVLIFMASLNFVTILLITSNSGLAAMLLFPLIGLLFAFLGNYMNNLKPNYFAGFRLPWTLNNDYNWKQTHQLAGKLWFWGGLLLAVVSFFIPISMMVPVLIVVACILIIIPSIYSYRLFKLGNQEEHTSS